MREDWELSPCTGPRETNERGKLNDAVKRDLKGPEVARHSCLAGGTEETIFCEHL